jgi:tripartite-type tricarboxylate transporter receptor subunit TctC
MRVNTELRAILGMPNVRERLAVLGLQPIPGSPEEHAAEIKAEFARWTPIIKATGMRVD